MEMIKEVESYWDNRPCNLKHSRMPIGTKEYFDEVEQKKYFVEPHIKEFAEFDKWKGKKVLEIGCGLGTETINFVRAGANVTVIELSKGSLNLAKKRAEVYGFKDRITFYHGNAEELDTVLEPQIFDLIWSFGVIHHSPYPEKIIEQIKKYMNSKTELRIMVYYKFSWKVFWIIMKFGKGAFWKINKLLAIYSEAQLGCPVTFAYSKSSFKELLKGLNIQDTKVKHIFPWKFPEYKLNEYKKVWYFRWIPKRVFRWLESKFGWHLCVKALKDNL